MKASASPQTGRLWCNRRCRDAVRSVRRLSSASRSRRAEVLRRRLRRQPTSPTPARDSLNGLTNLSPALGTALQAGQTVGFAGTAGYTLATADVGMVMMSIQDQADRPLQTSDPQPTVVVARGTATATLSQTVTLPTTGVTSVRLSFFLAPAGSTTTNVVLSVLYQLGERRDPRVESGPG